MKFRQLFRLKRTATADAAESASRVSVWPWDAASECTNPMKVATVYRCVKAIAEGVAVLPFLFERKDFRGIYTPADGQVGTLLDTAPNPNVNAYDFKRQMVQQLLCTGNAYVLPAFDESGDMREGTVRRLRSLTLVSPGCGSLDPVNMVYRVDDPLNRIHGSFLPGEIIHVRHLSGDGRTGAGVLQYAAQTSAIAAAGDSETLSRFRNGGNVRGFFTNQAPSVQGVNPYTDKFLKKIAEEHDFRFRNGQQLGYLPGNMQFKELMLSSADMQFLESRKFTTRELCFFFSIHPSYIGASESSNYKDAENASLAFLQSALNPILVQIESEFRLKLLTGKERERYRFRFDRSSLFACDLMTKAQWQEKQLGMGLSTLNELRLSENRPPVEGGDTPLVSANLKTVAQIENEGRGAAPSE